MNDQTKQTIEIFGFQPIKIRDNIFQDLIAAPNLLSKLPASSPLHNRWIPAQLLQNNSSPYWINPESSVSKFNFTLFYPDNQQTDTLEKDLLEQCEIELGKHFRIDKEKSSFSLAVNKFNCFMLIIHIHLTATTSICQFHYDKVPAAVRHVIEPQSNNIWSNAVIEASRQAVLEFLSLAYNKKVILNDITIGHNSLHIVSAFNGLDLPENELKNVCLKIHAAEERNNLKFDLALQKINPKTLAHFGWSYSTICNLDKPTVLACLPVVYYQQQNWHLTKFLRGYILETMLDISQNDNDLSLQKKSMGFDKLVVAFKLFLVDYADFKSTLKPFQWEIAFHIEDYWQLNESYAIIQDTFATVREYIGRKFTYKSNKIQRRQNLSLLVIALIQFIGIISVLESYLNLLHIDETTYQEFPFVQWAADDFVRLTIPIWLLLASGAILVYVYNELLLSGLAHKIRQFLGKE